MLGHSGDGGPAADAAIHPVAGMAIGATGEIYIGAWGGGIVRFLRPTVPGQQEPHKCNAWTGHLLMWAYNRLPGGSTAVDAIGRYTPILI